MKPEAMRTDSGTGLPWLLLGFAVLGCLSCGESPQASAYVQVNTRDEIEDLPRWTLTEVPEVSIGVLEGDPVEQFGSIRAGALGPHGMYVLDGSYNEVRVFDVTGRHVMSLGREGEGPGEFQNPTGLVVGLDSTITVWDRSLRRLTVFGHGGDVLRTASVQQSFLNPTLQSVFSDGSFVISDFRYPPSGIAKEGVGSLVLTAYSRDGQFLDTLEVLAGPHVSGVDYLGKPFATPDLVGSDRDGVWVLRVDTALIVRLDLGGDTLQEVTWEPLDREITESDFDALEAYESDWISDPEARAERIRHLREPGFAAARHPAAVRLATDGIGRVWLVERHDWERIQSPTWLVFGRSGRLVGRWEEPLENLSLLDANETTALVRLTDDLGIQRIELRGILEDGSPVAAELGRQ